MGGLTAIAEADSLTLDASGTNPNGAIDGSANWDTTASNAVWSNIQTAPAGTATDSAWNNAANNIAVFAGPAPGTITIDSGNVTASGLVFTGASTPAGYTITNNFSALNTLTLSGSTPTITTNGNGTIQTVIAGSSGFTKNGTGTLTLSRNTSQPGNASDTYTGTTTVAAGTLILGTSYPSTLIPGDMVINTGATVVSEDQNLISTSSNVVVNGTLALGLSPGQSVQTLAGLTGTGTVALTLSSVPTLGLNISKSQTFAGTITGTGSVSVNATQANLVETWTGTNTFNGTVQALGGILSVASVQALGTNETVLLNGGTVRYTGTQSALIEASVGVNGGTIDASGTGALSVSGPGTGSSLLATSPTLILSGTSTASNKVIEPIQNPGPPANLALVKNGTGTWILTSPGNTYAGGTQINAGILGLQNNSSLGAGNVTLNAGGTLEMISQNATLATASGKTFTAGGGTLYLNQSPSVAMQTLTRSTGGGMVIEPTSSTALGTTEKVTVVAGVPVVNGIVDASLVAQTSTSDTSADFLTYSAPNGFARATYSTATVITNGVTNGTSSTSVFHATTATNNTAATPTTLYALKVDSGAAVSGALTLGDGTHTAGLIINNNGGSFAPTILGASIAFAAGSEGAVYVGGNIASVPPGFQPNLPQAVLINTVSGTKGLTKNGNGILEMGHAVYTGTTTINEGFVQFDLAGGGTGANSTSVIALAGSGGLLYGGPPTPVQATVNLGSEYGSIGAAANATVNFQGTVNGNGHALNIVSAAGSGLVNWQGTASNISQVNVAEGTLQVGGNFETSSTPINVYDAVTVGQSASVLSINSGVTISNPITLNSGGYITGANNTGPGSSTVAGTVMLQDQSQLENVVENGGSINLAGSIQGSGPLNLMNGGTGTITISGNANTYTGTTNLYYGKVVVTGDITSSSQVNISGASEGQSTLMGTGAVGEINVGVKGKLAPGLKGTGTMTATGLTWNSDGTGQLQFNLGATPDTSTKLSLGTGAFTKGTGSSFLFDFLGTGVEGQDYTLITFGAGDTNFLLSDFQASDLSPGLSGTFSLVTDGPTERLEFDIAEAPEPGTTSLLVSGVFGLLLFARARRRV